MCRRVLWLMLLAGIPFGFTRSASAQATLSMPSYEAPPGATLTIPITFTASGTARLNPQKSVNERPQAIAIRINVSPQDAIAEKELRRAGPAAAQSPAWVKYVVMKTAAGLLMQFDSKHGPLNLSPTGDVIAEIRLTISPAATGTIALRFDNKATEVTNEAATIALSNRDGTMDFVDAAVNVVPGTVPKVITTKRSPLPPLPPASKVEPEVTEALRRRGVADVIVSLVDPVGPAAPNITRASAVQNVQSQVLAHIGPTAKVHMVYALSSAIAMTIDSGLLEKLTVHPLVRFITLDSRVQFSLCDSLILLRADQVHAGSGPMLPHDGGPGRYQNGTWQPRAHRIAIIDSGYETNDFLAGKIYAEVAIPPNYNRGGNLPSPCFPSDPGSEACIPTIEQCLPKGHPACDVFLHGTWMAQTVAARNNQVSCDAPLHIEGFAPGAELVIIRIDVSQTGSSQESYVLGALDFIEAHPELGIDIVSMSWNLCDSQPPYSPYKFSSRDACDIRFDSNIRSTINRLRENSHILFFQATGNHGYSDGVTAPGCFTNGLVLGQTVVPPAGTPRVSTVTAVSGTYDRIDYSSPQPTHDSPQLRPNNNYPTNCPTSSPWLPWSWYCQSGWPGLVEFPLSIGSDDGQSLGYPVRKPLPHPSEVVGFANAAPSLEGQFAMVDLVAPATFIQMWDNASYSGPNFVAASGTSFSAPMAASAAALIEQARPELTLPCEAEEIVRGSADNVETATATKIAPGSSGLENVFPRLDVLNVVRATDPATMRRGDSDGDGDLDDADADLIVNYLFADAARPRWLGANVNHDCVITPSDIFFLINRIHNGGPEPAP